MSRIDIGSVSSRIIFNGFCKIFMGNNVLIKKCFGIRVVSFWVRIYAWFRVIEECFGLVCGSVEPNHDSCGLGVSIR